MYTIKMFEDEVFDAFDCRDTTTFKSLYLYSVYMKETYNNNSYYEFLYDFIYNEINNMKYFFTNIEKMNFLLHSLSITSIICNNILLDIIEQDNTAFIMYLLKKHIIVEELITSNSNILKTIKSVKMLKLLHSYGLNIHESCYIFDYKTYYFEISPLYNILFDKKFDDDIIYSFVKTFLELGANPNYKRNLGSIAYPLYDTTPLMAVSYKYSYKNYTAQKLIAILLQYGAKTNIKDLKKKTIFDYLIERKKYNVIDFIKNIEIMKLLVVKKFLKNNDILIYLKTFLY